MDISVACYSHVAREGNLELGPADTGLHSEFTWPIVQEDFITSWSLGINLTYSYLITVVACCIFMYCYCYHPSDITTLLYVSLSV